VLAAQRRTAILDEVRREGAVRVADLATSLGVSQMTVRRDLEDLSEAGLIAKVHGGATSLASSSALEPAFAAKAERQRAAKAAIATEAARLVEPGSAIAVSGGTTTCAFARCVASVPRLTVVTNSLPVAEALHASGRDDRTVILTGGVRTPSDALVGPVAVDALRSLHVDLAFLGAHGMDLESGFSTPNILEAETNRALASVGQRLVVLADHTKWGVVGLRTFAALDDADVLVTDAGLSRQARTTLAEHVATVVVAPVTDRLRDAS
jgi:DeoR/GlpR family transcriptional regulator of sugar metabolism